MGETDPVPTQQDSALPETFELLAAGFEDIHEIGRGGFGIVYRCRQPDLDRTVAVKILTAEPEGEDLERFLREQRAMGRLSGHPNVVAIHEVGTTASGRPYIVMDFHRRDSLHARIQKHGPLGWEAALRMAIKVAGALETAHRLGMLHRDVKPANILLTDYDEPQLTDFGIARVTGGFETGERRVAGSPAFTAPEVITGQPPSAAADVYGLGATLFCAITGHAAYERRSGESVVAQFLRIAREPLPDLHSGSIPDDLSEVIARAMNRDPASRIGTPAELGEQLRAVESRHGLVVDELPVPSASSIAGPPPIRARRDSIAEQPNTVPADLTSFVGRRADVAAVRQLLTNARLVTLTGIGGVGKTRLAFRVARDVRRAFPDGVGLVELASLKDPDLLPHTVIDALAIREQSARPSMTVLCDHLRERHSLIVIDNCEHLVEATAELVDQVLRAAPDVRIVATSRQALRIAGEHVYAVPPLPAPDPDEKIERGTATTFPSVALFADRSAAVVPGFAITPANEAAVIRLCHRLEGIPLAIELASVRLRVLTVDDLESRLDDRFQELREGSRNQPERHRTLQALIDWSNDLCTPAERTLWARASIFAGGFGIDALESVCTDGSLPPDAVLDTVAGLLDKSIFAREEQGRHVRFRMLETIRAYGHARLTASGDEPALRRRHRDWYLERVETAGVEWVGLLQQDWATSLQAEHANLRSALEYSVTQPGQARIALRMAAVPWFWIAMGHLAEGKLWLDRSLALDDEPSHERAWALSTGAYIAGCQGDVTEANVLLDEARDLAVRLDDRAAIAYVSHVLAVCQMMFGTDLAGATFLFAEALELYAETDVPSVYPDFLRIELATVLILAGEAENAAVLIDELIERFQAIGGRWQLSYALWERGLLRLLGGELDGAEADLRESIIIKRSFHDAMGLALALDVLAWTTAANGDAERAATLLGGMNKLWMAVGARLFGSQHLLAMRERYERMARTTIGNTEFDAAFERGSAHTIEETLAIALRESTRQEQEPHPAPALTRREREVAGLVAEGLSNKEIAARLVISLRTAEGHVENILTKLGFTSRTQIASWVLQQ